VIALLRDPARLAAIRSHLDRGRSAFALFDGKRFAADIERLYERMVERERLGLPPAALAAEAAADAVFGAAALSLPEEKR
jgi:hypothetical protein